MIERDPGMARSVLGADGGAYEADAAGAFDDAIAEACARAASVRRARADAAWGRSRAPMLGKGRA